MVAFHSYSLKYPLSYLYDEATLCNEKHFKEF